MPAPPAFSYRPEIDGLRAVAVVPVVLYHAGYPVFSGGFVGVDIFFVISGYLICSLILKELDQGEFSLLAFFERRARRIFPALFLVVLATALLGLLLLFPGDLKRLGSGMAGVGTFLSNVVFSRQLGYFDAASEFNPLIHTWSLAVEEQFYLLFPPLLWLVWKWGEKRAAILFLALFAVSLGIAELTVREFPNAAFFLPHTRAWELLTGVLAAIYLHRREVHWPMHTSAAAGAAGLALIGWSIFWLDAATPFPSLFALPVVLGTALIIVFTRQNDAIGRMLARKPIVAVGLVSYSLYLWHQPLFAYARHLYVPDAYGLMMPAMIVLSCILAWLSWRYVERPFRDRSKFKRITVALASIAGLGTITVSGVALYFSDGFPDRFSPEVLAELNVLVKPDTKTDHCKIRQRQPDAMQAAVRSCYVPGKTLFLIGDSHAEEIDLALREAAERDGYSLITMVEHACPAIEGASHHLQSQACTSLKAQMRAITRQFPAPVVLSSRWRYFVTGQPFSNGEGGQEWGPPMPMLTDGRRAKNPLHQLQSSIDDWSDESEILIVDQIPEAGWLVTRALARRVQTGRQGGAPLSTSYAEYKRQNAEIIAMFGQLARQKDSVRLVRTAPMVCSDQTGRCLNERGGKALYYDDDHPSIVYSRQIADEILRKLRKDELL